MPGSSTLEPGTPLQNHPKAVPTPPSRASAPTPARREAITTTTHPLTAYRHEPADGSLTLGPLRIDLIDTYLRWTNAPIVMRGNGRPRPETREILAAGVEARLAGDNMHCTVDDITRAGEDGGPLPVGTTSLSIDNHVESAEYFIVLGEEGRGRGRGLAAPATRLALAAAFARGLYSVHLAVLAPDTAAIRAYECAGFAHIGVRRGGGLWNGQRCDEVLMDVLSSDTD